MNCNIHTAGVVLIWIRAFAFQWTSSSTFPNGTLLKTCIGDNVTLPWTFTTNSADGIFIEWIKLSVDQDKSILADYNQDTLFKSKSKRRLEFVPNAGLLLPDVTLSDTGNYSVQIRVLNEAEIYQQSAFVRVSNQLSKTPVTTDEGLRAFILNESSFQLSTRQWHAQLGCGKFLSRDHPSVSVIWKTPSDRTINSTSYKNHVSILTLPNPAEEGDYSCFLDRVVIAEQCLQNHFNLSRLSDTAATVNIKETDIRLVLLEGNVEALWKQNGDPTNGLFDLANIVQLLQSHYNQSAKDVKELQLQLQSNYNQSAKDVKELQLQLQSNYQSAKDVKNLWQQVENTTKIVQELKIRNEKLSSALQELQSKYDALATTFFYDQFGLSRIPSKDDLERQPRSCQEVKNYNPANGIHTIYLSNNININVYCDQTTDNGGWLVIQRRQDGSVNFYRDWEEYQLGFGNLKTEFWIGLTNIYLLTKNQNFRLRIDLTEFDGTTTYAVYNTFSISGASDNYRLRVGGYSGTAGDDLSYHNNLQFTTRDWDHDTNPSGNCAQMFNASWWFGACFEVNLNGPYNTYWNGWKDRELKRMEMKIKL